jgi:hypothetical protein
MALIASMTFGIDRYHQPGRLGNGITVATTSPERGHTRMRFTNPRISSEEVAVGNQRFTDLWIEGESQTTEPGRPQLPVVTRLIGIPDNGAVQLRVVSSEYTEQTGVRVFPFQTLEDPSLSSNPSLAEATFHWDQNFYNQNTWYPAEIATLGEPAVLRDVRLAAVSICPVQYNPATGTVRTYQTIEVEVVPAPGVGTNEKVPHPQFAHPSSLFMPLYRQLENFDQLGLDEATALPGTFLIICANNPTPISYANSIAQWKRRKGIYTRVATRAETGNSFSQIQWYIQNAYNTWDPPLEYVLLLGDDSANPNDPFHVPSSGGYGGSDHPYTQVAGGDILGDIAIGRLSAGDAQTMSLVVAKSLRYDQNPYTTGVDWFSKAYLLAGTTYGLSSNVQTMEWIQNQMYHNGFTEVVLQTHSGHINAAQMREQVNLGRSFFLWRGGWVSEMAFSDLNGLNNGWMMPFVFVLTCGTGNFASDFGLSEAWIRYGSITNGGGAVACVGTATSGTHTRFNNIIASGIGYGFFVDHYAEAGMALMDAKLQLYRSYYPQNSTEVTEFSDWENLMGDPGQKIWTDFPNNFQVIYPTTIALGTNRVPVLVRDTLGNPLEDAMVCVMNPDGSGWNRAFTDASGYLEMPASPDSVGALWLTVCKTNYLTFAANIAVYQPLIWVAFDSAAIDDDNIGGTSGNGDHVLNPGETVDATITARNFGNTGTAAYVYGTLFGFNNSLTQVITGEQAFPDMAPGAEVQSQGAFRIQVSTAARDQDVTPLLLQFQSGSVGSLVVDTSLVPLTVVSGAAHFRSYHFLVSNNRLDPGETEQLTLTIDNLGHRSMTNLVAHAFCSDTLITFGDPNANFGTIAVGGTGTNNGDPFQITANAATIPGHIVQVGAALSGDNGLVDTVYFSTIIGAPATTNPTGPDAYGYYCFDNTDTQYEGAPQYSWIEVNPAHGGAGTILPLYDNWENGDDSATLLLPFVFRYYGTDFDTLTVCSNGWAALGDSRYCTDFRNHPIPGPQGPDAMIAPFWDDLVIGSGHVCWDYIENSHLAVIEWSACRTLTNSYDETFEIILYDPAYYLTQTGDGLIKFQYQTVYNGWGAGDDNDFATVGIESPTQSIGLQLSYWNSYAPGVASLAASRAYLFVPGLTYGSGVYRGRVTDSETGNPLTNALVSLASGVYWDSTDTQGYFTLSNIPVNHYSVLCSLAGYNSVQSSINLTPNDTTVQNFPLAHPEFLLDTQAIQHQVAQGGTYATTFHLSNQGNGELSFQIAFDAESAIAGTAGILLPGNTRVIANPDQTEGHAPSCPIHRGSGSIYLRSAVGPVRQIDATDDPWEQRLLFDVTQSTTDHLIQGVAFAWGKFWVAGGGLGAGSTHYLYKFNTQGNYQGQVLQPTTSQVGFHDLAWDGQYLWGSDSKYLVALDSAGAIHDSIEGVLSPSRALTYDPGEDVFYTGNITAPIVVVNRDGTEVRRYTDHNLHIYGLAWYSHDPDRCPLYLFCRDGDQTRLRLEKMNPNTGEIQSVADLDGRVGDLAGGAVITPNWDHSVWVFVGQITGTSSDQIGVWEIGPNTAWIICSPTIGTVAPGGQQAFQLLLDANGLPVGDYHLNLVLQHNAIGNPDTLPVTMTVTTAGIDPGEEVTPLEYSLGQNYPNPFNPTTAIPYMLRETGVVNLTVYNVLGQKVATLVQGRQEAGVHRALLDASSMASGIYFYRLEAGHFNAVRKMVLIK